MEIDVCACAEWSRCALGAKGPAVGPLPRFRGQGHESCQVIDFHRVFCGIVAKDLTERDFFPILRCLSGEILP